MRGVEARIHTVTGTVEFIWETDQELLLNLEPDRPEAPHTFEISGTLREQLIDALTEGDRVEIDFVPTPHEVIDPDSGPTESTRTHVHDVRVVRRR
jgi:hypothetical protein